jgi:hypothetical protein
MTFRSQDMDPRACFLVLAPVLVIGAPAESLQDWQAFSPADGAFTIQVPGKPHEFKKKIETADGPAELFIYEAPLGTAKFVVSYSEIPKSKVIAGTEDKRLDNARDGAVKSSKGKLKEEKSLLLDKNPGRELTIEVDGKTAVVLRLYAVKNRLYQVGVFGSPDVVDPQDVQKFLTSFQLNAK